MTQIILIILAIFLLLLVVYLLTIKGRTGHKNTEEMLNYLYAHRGYHSKPEIPENSLAAFRLAVEKGYGAELDVHLLKDGNLAVIHDDSLLRTTGREGNIEDLTTEDLQDYYLEGTSETIPTLKQVLDVFDGKTPLIIELKTANNNFVKLSRATCALLEDYKGLYCIESFDPRCIEWLAKKRPEVMRGQLSGNFMKEESHIKGLQAFILTFMFWNIKTRPDFIAYHFESRHNLSNILCRDLWHMSTASWTLKTQQDLDTARREGAMAIFEQFEPQEY